MRGKSLSQLPLKQPKKKCVPGTMYCMNNMTLFICTFLILVVGYLWVRVSNLGKNVETTSTSNRNQITSSILLPSPPSLPIQDIRGDVGRCGAGRGDPLTNPYVPPVRCDSTLTTPTIMIPPPNNGSFAVNVPTQSYNTQYSQIGILTRQSGLGQQDILPLMGRRSPNSRDKWQYYSVAGGGAGGNLQTKLPVKVKGRSCSGEYGCDEIYNQDHVYVEGYQDDFIATIYESGLFSYLP